jgi:hypothetical protein
MTPTESRPPSAAGSAPVIFAGNRFAVIAGSDRGAAHWAPGAARRPRVRSSHCHASQRPRSVRGVITRENLFFGAAVLAMAIAGVVMWLIFFAPPAGCRQVRPNEYLCDHPLSGPNPPGQLQP